MRIATRVDRVTVFERGARVTRLAVIHRASGDPLPRHIIATGLPLAVLDDSVRVRASAARATTATVILEAPGIDETLPAAHASALRDATRAAAIADGEIERIRREMEAIEGSQLIVDLDHQPTMTPPWQRVVAARRELSQLRQQRLHDLRLALIEAGAHSQACNRAVEVASDAEQRRSSARSPRARELRKAVVIELEAATPSGDGVADIELTVEYALRGARWAPSYVARFSGHQVHWSMRASVSQQTGEDWHGVAIRLSTAALDRDTALPELAALKIGRRQREPEPSLPPLPLGGDTLFSDYDRDFSMHPAPIASAPPSASGPRIDIPSQPEPAPALPLEESSADDQEDTKVEAYSRARSSVIFGAAPRPSTMRKSDAPPALAASPARSSSNAHYGAAPQATAARYPMMHIGELPRGAGGSRSAMPAPAKPVAQYRYGELMMAGARHPQRGQLVAMSLPQRYGVEHELDVPVLKRRFERAQEATDRIDRAPVPAGFYNDWSHEFDYAIDADGRIDVASDGGWHSIPMCTRSTPAAITHVVVPRDAAEVFRIATFANPLEVPILPGPVDVYQDDRFLVTSAAAMAPPGGELVLPLGVDPTIKIARNTEYREEVIGMLRGGLRLVHDVRIEVQNRSNTAVDLEVRERVPVPRQRDSDEIAVEITAVKPAWQAWTAPLTSAHHRELRGGYRWRLTVAASETVSLHASYDVRIAGKHEIIGGNRRER